MFKCEQCKKVSQPCEKAHKKVVQTRTTPNFGTEIVKELTVCAGCKAS